MEKGLGFFIQGIDILRVEGNDEIECCYGFVVLPGIYQHMCLPGKDPGVIMIELQGLVIRTNRFLQPV